VRLLNRMAVPSIAHTELVDRKGMTRCVSYCFTNKDTCVCLLNRMAVPSLAHTKLVDRKGVSRRVRYCVTNSVKNKA
jgi:hypothetical protein